MIYIGWQLGEEVSIFHMEDEGCRCQVRELLFYAAFQAYAPYTFVHSREVTSNHNPQITHTLMGVRGWHFELSTLLGWT